jgi:tetratricopeptide (TPR) repeat protein
MRIPIDIAPAESYMATMSRVPAFILILLLAACAAYNVGGQFVAGRQALLRNDLQTALGYFLAAAQSDPNYVFRAVYFHEGIWTYVGRAQYATKRYQDAGQSLERALSMDKDDHLARLYLGLTLARSGDLSRGIKEIENAMRGIFDWLEYINRTRPFEAYWDPARDIRKAIEKDLDYISSKDFNPEQLIADAEWLGKRMEEEIDQVRQDERREFDRNFDRRRGVSLGVGIGF